MAQRIDYVKPKPGDLIEIFRVGYQHWAIYVGHGYVIHLTTPGEAGSSRMMSASDEKGFVKQEKLLDVVRGDKYRINNLLDKKYEPRSVSDILKDARSRLGQELPYNLILRNCEHFATDLRYGKPESRQVRDAAINAGIGVGVIAGILVILLALGAIRRDRRAAQDHAYERRKKQRVKAQQ